ncbi:MAG: GGDEF domain-containing protein [Candidatus Limnocylindria bacterium]
MELSRARRATRAVILLLLVSLPLALVSTLRFGSPDSVAGGWLAWIPIPIAIAGAAGVVAVIGLVQGLRRGTLAPMLLAGAAAAVAGGAVGLLTGSNSLAVPLTGAGAFVLAAALSDRLGAMVHGRGTRIGAAAGVFAAAEAIVLAGVLPAATEITEPVQAALLALAAILSLLAAIVSAGRPLMVVTASLSVAAAALAVGDDGGVEQLTGMLALIGSQLIGLYALLSEPSVPADVEERSLPELATRLNDAVLRFDGRLQLIDWNPSATQILGLDAASTGTRLEDLLGIAIADLPARDEVVTHRGVIGGLEVDLHRSGGGLTAIVRDPAGTPETERLGRELRGTIEELLQTRRTVELQRTELERASTIDALTGVASRSAVLDRLRTEMAQARRYQHPVAVVLLDVDHFAELNRLHGITGGDAILREVALRVRLRVREADALGRAGSDSFLAILPHTDEGGAATFADALRNRLTRRLIGVRDAQVAVTLSIGVALLREGEDLDLDGLLARVDEALASARGAGGDRIALDRLHGLARLEGRRSDPVAEDETAQDSGA